MTAHAGPKTQFGGFHIGLRRLRYQSPAVVVMPPNPKTKTVMMTATMIGSFISILSFSGRIQWPYDVT